MVISLSLYFRIPNLKFKEEETVTKRTNYPITEKPTRRSKINYNKGRSKIKLLISGFNGKT